MQTTSRIHIPRVPARPGEKPDFSYLKISEPGEIARPRVDVGVQESLQLSQGLVRVLDDHHQAVGPWQPSIEPGALRLALRHMLTVRVMDERMQRAQRQGRISFYMKSTGEEAVSIAQAMALQAGDMLFPSYRTQGLHIARDGRPFELMCQCLSNTADMCKGRQMPVFYHSRARNIFSVSGNVATQYPQAVGWAMAATIKGSNDIAAVWVGEGSSAEADFHYALTFASVYQAPVLLNVVNNQWAISTFQGFAGGERASFAARGPGFGITGIRVDGNDFLAVYSVTQWAAARARSGSGPTLIELVTYRASAHSTSDDPTRYRARDEAQAWPLGDPIVRLRNHLYALGEWDEGRDARLSEEITQYIEAEWKDAMKRGTLTEEPRLDPSLMFEDVYKEVPQHLKLQRAQLEAERS